MGLEIGTEDVDHGLCDPNGKLGILEHAPHRFAQGLIGLAISVQLRKSIDYLVKFFLDGHVRASAPSEVGDVMHVEVLWGLTGVYHRGA